MPNSAFIVGTGNATLAARVRRAKGLREQTNEALTGGNATCTAGAMRCSFGDPDSLLPLLRGTG